MEERSLSLRLSLSQTVQCAYHSVHQSPVAASPIESHCEEKGRHHYWGDIIICS